MTYLEWFHSHAQKHRIVVEKLISKNYTKEQIIEYFDFDNMVKNENNFCFLYEDNKKCHDMKSLNCYLCACPHFRFNDDGLDYYNEFKILSKCDINNGEKLAVDKVIHHDCSKCSVPHHKAFISKNFDLNWKNIMRKCFS